MNILVLSPFFPYPLNNGGKIRVFNLIKYLSRRHRMTLACLCPDMVIDHGPLKDFCEKIVCIERPSQTFQDLACFLLGKRPFNDLRYSSAEFRTALAKLCRANTFDVVLVEFPMLWQYADMLSELPIALDAHNIEYHLIQNLRQQCRNPIKRTLYALEEYKFKRMEESAWRDCRCCFAVSEKEKEFISRSLCEPNKVITAPNGVDLEKFEFVPKKTQGGRILFLGGMDWAPNLDSARFFLGEILPLIRKKMPQAQVDFVGKDLWRLKDLTRTEGIRLHENVPDVLPWFRRADLLVVPLRQGAGTRIKILEAMACGLPVITTAKGSDGTEAVHGKHLLVADSANDFAEAVFHLSEDASLGAQITREARKLVEEKYSWEMAADTIDESLSRWQ